MKTINKIVFCTLYIVALSFFAGCKNENVVFDHEQPQFETRANAILIEFIAPTGTAVDEEIYIFGAFNGEDEKSVIGNVEWQLEKAANSDKKWGIYLFPDEFAEGKTLADGFAFASNKSGGERDMKGTAVVHTLDAQTGVRYNIWSERWAKFFDGGGDEIKHNGYAIFVFDESGFADLSLYLYGDIDDLNGSWPGMKPTGKQTINDIEFTYFDMGEVNSGRSETLIFSDNGSKQLADYGPVVFNEDIYLHIKEDGTIEKMKVSAEHDGPVVYVLDGIGWGMATTLYMWGDINDLNGGWPGMSPTGTEAHGDYTYMYYDLGANNEGRKESLIFSNNGKNQLGDYPGSDQLYTLSGVIYLYITTAGVTVIEDPENPGEVTWFDPKPVVKEEAVVDLYLYDSIQTIKVKVVDPETNEESDAPLYIYSWGTSEIFGGWPGQSFEDIETITVLGLTLYHIRISCYVGDAYHLIVNNGKGKQLPDYDVEVTDKTDERYLKMRDSGIVPLEVIPKIRRR